MNYKDNQPTFNVNRKVVNFKDFAQDKEKLSKADLQRKPNSEDQQHLGNRRTEYNPVSHKLTDYSADEIKDRLDAIEDFEESNESNKYTYTLLNKNNKEVEIEANDVEDANLKIVELHRGSDPMLTHINGKQINWEKLTLEGIFSDRYDDSSDITSEEKKICLKVYGLYQRECLNSDGDYSMKFDQWLKSK